MKLFYNFDMNWKIFVSLLLRVLIGFLFIRQVVQWYFMADGVRSVEQAKEELRIYTIITIAVLLLNIIVCALNSRNPKIRLFSIIILCIIMLIWIKTIYPMDLMNLIDEFSVDTFTAYIGAGSVLFSLVLYIIEAVRCIL